MNKRGAINWFEIPVTDMARAVAFYERLLGVKLKQELFGGKPNAIFMSEGTGGALIVDPKRRPSSDGAMVYLDARDELDACLARAGAAVVLPKTDIGEPGFIGIVRDPDGNLVGLHQPRSR